MVLAKNWQKVNTIPVCFGARDEKHGAFTIQTSGQITTIKLVRKSGSICCNPKYNDCYWGCKYSGYGVDALLTLITNSTRTAIVPPVQELMSLEEGNNCPTHFYRINGTSHKSPTIIFKNLSRPFPVSRYQELQICRVRTGLVELFGIEQ